MTFDMPSLARRSLSMAGKPRSTLRNPFIEPSSGVCATRNGWTCRRGNWRWRMHDAAYDYVQRFATEDAIALLDIGGRSVNGTGRPLFPNAKTTVLDIRKGDDVDIVADAATWERV